MSEYDQIVNPTTNRRVNIFSNLGRKILSNYIIQHQSAGYVKRRDSEDLEHLHSHGGSSYDSLSTSDNSLFSEIPGYQDGGDDSESDDQPSFEYIRPGVRVLSPKPHREYIRSGVRSLSQGGGSAEFDWTAAKVINTDADFVNMVNSNADKLMMIYAPWCGHCVTTKPLFDMVANNNTDSNKEYYALDGDNPVVRSILEKNGLDVMAYPTLKKMLKRDGNNITDYNDTRNEYDLTHFNDE